MNVVNICMGGNKSQALGNWEINLTNKLDYFINIVFIPDVDENPFVFVKKKIDTASYSPSSLVVNFDDAREKWSTFKHCKVIG